MKILTMLFSMLFLLKVRAFNSRTMCFSNQIILNNQYNVFNSFLLRSEPYIANLQRQMHKYLLTNARYNYPITNISNLTRYSTNGTSLKDCGNIVIGGVSCCPQFLFENYTNVVNLVYNRLLENTSYPIIEVLKNLIGNISLYSCSYSNSLAQSSTLLKLLNQSAVILKSLDLDERKFINETACLICIGTLDFHNFILPSVRFEDLDPASNTLMFQKQYFNSRLDNLTKILNNLQALHSSISAEIIKIAQSITSSGAECVGLQSQYSSMSFLNNWKLCIDETSCRKIAQRYFGHIISPHLMLLIRRKGLGLLMIDEDEDYVVSEEPGVGYMGNKSYTARWGTQKSKYIVKTTIKPANT